MHVHLSETEIEAAIDRVGRATQESATLRYELCQSILFSGNSYYIYDQKRKAMVASGTLEDMQQQRQNRIKALVTRSRNTTRRRCDEFFRKLLYNRLFSVQEDVVTEKKFILEEYMP